MVSIQVAVPEPASGDGKVGSGGISDGSSQDGLHLGLGESNVAGGDATPSDPGDEIATGAGEGGAPT